MDENGETPEGDRKKREEAPGPDWEALRQEIALRYAEVLARLAD